jgi:hypothetical protein
MGRGKKNPAGHRGGDVRDRHAARGSDEERWDPGNLEDDPLADLRPHDDDMLSAVGDEYVWPDLSDENNEDD